MRWLRWPILLTLLAFLLAPGFVAAQQLYKCTTADGRLSMSDIPCPTGSAQTVIEPLEQRPTSTPPSKSRSAKTAKRRQQPLSADGLEPEVPLKECVHLNDAATVMFTQGRHRRTMRWKADVSNRCRRPLGVTVTFGVYDRDEFEIQAQRKKLRLPPRDNITVQGALSLSAGEAQRIASKKTEMVLQ